MKFIVFKRPALRNAMLWAILLFVVLAYRENVISVFSNKLKPVYSAEVTTNEIGLTFDISWGEKTPEPILDILKEKGVKATFFLSSPWASKHEDLVKRMVADGHEIASHGNRHVDLNTLSPGEIEREIMTAHEVLQHITGQKISLLRPPNGAYDNKLISVSQRLGYQVIQWSVDSLDWKRPGPEAVIRNVLNGLPNGHGARPGDIILFHASDSAPDTIKALPVVIDQLIAKNYQLVPVGQLLKSAAKTWPPESNLPPLEQREAS
ncbi:putative xylanase/chitin deacetylase [Desulfitobacterium dehalogenans ATCC 51507]|uniref:Putative xylanase/chitin deacetylase n=1 Tax=Desulfitobacterium dehalogenans (strain ATCC 51507 / DSM 9161 / JW/IU-DC1) TaxID=756499 RepID=I4AA26_DESDJ|nr:polysaccharide deacetylase family protein [Desulfitobacterium dehalogenans]AFM00811.1 putative xylanase/chitin deacetylase [Desulfitobacterium dehalogenans ATCC 51507]